MSRPSRPTTSDEHGAGSGPVPVEDEHVGAANRVADPGTGFAGADDGANLGHDLGDDLDGHHEEPDGYAPFVTFDDRSYVRVPRRRRRLRRAAAAVGILSIVALVAVAGAGWWVLRQINPPGGPGQVVTVVVPEGASAAAIADLLDDAGVVGNARIFREYIKVKGDGADGDFQAGPYALHRGSSMSEALEQLKAGPVPVATAQVTFPEGLRLTTSAPSLVSGVPWFTAEGVDQALGSVRSPYQPADVATLEGLLFPDTYAFAEGDTEVQAVTKMVEQLQAVGRELDLDARAAELGYTPYEIITIASMIEREAVVPEDRGKIARVIYNRLGEDMRLDIDATVLYALGDEDRTLSASDLETDSPYNTRLHKGLPPTPIAAPGRASLEAALDPTPGDWLYYVVEDSQGHHFFTADQSEFEDAVAAAERNGLIS